VDFKDLEALISIFEKSDLTEIEIEEEGRRMRLQKASPVAIPAPTTVQVPTSVQPGATAAEEAPAEDALPDGLITIDSPMVGTFYVAPAPGEEPFVKIGDTVEEKQTVCIVEAMKLMNEVGAKVPCIIEQILVEDAEPVEFGQPLFAVRPR
jgi:acetyl-CoA carboxylase biotin carboxyl carrier protein